MGECPFCKAQIDEEILLYGGTCPTCLIEIPGEESATDPGGPAEPTETTRAILESHGMSKQTSPIMWGVVTAGLLLGVGGIWLVLGGSDSTVHTEEADSPSQFESNEVLAQAPPVSDNVPVVEQTETGVEPLEQATEAKSMTTSAGTNQSNTRQSSSQSSSGSTNTASSEADSKPKTTQVGSYIYQDSRREAIGQSGPASPQEIKEEYKSILRSEGLGCVQRVAEDGEQPRGDLEFQYTVKTDGTVTGRQVRTSEGLSDQRLLNCFETALNLKVKKYRPIEEQVSVSLRFSY